MEGGSGEVAHTLLRDRAETRRGGATVSPLEHTLELLSRDGGVKRGARGGGGVAGAVQLWNKASKWWTNEARLAAGGLLGGKIFCQKWRGSFFSSLGREARKRPAAVRQVRRKAAAAVQAAAERRPWSLRACQKARWA